MITSKSTKVIFLATAILSVASAFNNKAASTKMATVSVLDAQTARPSRGFSTGMYGSRVQAWSSPSSFSQTIHKHTSIRTRLQFSDNASPDTTIESSWWRKLFASTLPSPKTIASASSDESSLGQQMEEQENVDAYLEFLDRRYRRLHSDDEKEEKAQTDYSVSKKGKSFAAIEWLTNGGSNTKIDATTSQQQQQDALYVLGVAGLASQKLLQKHHLQTTTTNPSQQANLDKVVELKEQIDDAIEVNDTTKSLKTKVNHAVLNNVVLPFLRVIYLAQRQKQLFLKMVQRGLVQLASKVTDGVVGTLSQGPRFILNAVFTACGGKQNILRTMAIGCATIVLFRPLLRAVFADGLAFDPLIQ